MAEKTKSLEQIKEDGKSPVAKVFAEASRSSAESTPTENKEPDPTQESIQIVDRSRAKKGPKPPWSGPVWLYTGPSDKAAVLCNSEEEYDAALKAGAKDTWTPEAWA